MRYLLSSFLQMTFNHLAHVLAALHTRRELARGPPDPPHHTHGLEHLLTFGANPIGRNCGNEEEGRGDGIRSCETPRDASDARPAVRELAGG